MPDSIWSGEMKSLHLWLTNRDGQAKVMWTENVLIKIKQAGMRHGLYMATVGNEFSLQ